jgi:hypothetical protein
MKKVILLAVFLPYLANGQIIENFESASLANWVQGTEGHWKADTTKSLSGRYSLHHVFDNSLPGYDCIGIPVRNLHPDEGLTRWTFLIRHGCDPSASNNWCAYLVCDTDTSALKDGKVLNGYGAGVDLTGNDDTLRLWKVKNGAPSVIATCPVNWQNDIGTTYAVKLLVERSVAGYWKIEVYDNQDKMQGRASGFDSELFTSSFFMLGYRYTSTRDRLLWFDDLKIEGVFHEDTQPPVVVSCQVSGINSIDLTLDEDPSDDFMLLSNFSLAGDENAPVMIIRESTKTFRLTFNNKFRNKTLNKLIINHLCDRSSNCDERISVEFTLIQADPGDVIISEIMADPVPAVSLPAKEYLEITNRAGFRFNLKNWSLSTEGQNASFPGVNINAGEYIILCPVADTSAFSCYGKVIGLKPFPSLTDDGRKLWISDSLGNLIHGLVYSSAWYKNKLKETGGWSLEMIDTRYPFYGGDNWDASTSGYGGTPGKSNSSARSNPDRQFYGIENVFPDDSVTLRVNFSETVFEIAGSPGKISISGREAVSVSSDDPLLRSFVIKSPISFFNGEVYSLNVSPDVTDFAGNPESRTSFRFGLPEKAGRGDIVFNELLFNPFPDEPDFVELYNCSDKTIDASQLYFASINIESGDSSEIFPLSYEHRCIIPDGFFAVTADREQVIERYNSCDPENIFNISSLPSLPDDRGHLLLLNRNLDLIDEVSYSDEMHYPLLVSKEGVSLEKIRPEMESGESTSWYSASESSGWGTPGKENSVFAGGQEWNDRIIFSSARISPDNDGTEDVLVIDINAEGLGNVVSVTIFDETGGYVRRLSENIFAGSKTSIAWDGTTDDGSLVSTGVYIVLIQLYNEKGKTRSWKKVCTVIR